MTQFPLTLRYGIFAVIAVLANLATQRLALVLVGGAPGYILALGSGTLDGLVVKFLLDKRWIFFDAMQDVRAEARKFSLYTLTGVATTLIFWISETVFWLIGGTVAMREFGAVLGLAIGYAIKFRLDRAFVFPTSRSDCQEKKCRRQT